MKQRAPHQTGEGNGPAQFAGLHTCHVRIASLLILPTRVFCCRDDSLLKSRLLLGAHSILDGCAVERDIYTIPACGRLKQPR
jgi:hypothetical protein